MEAKPNPPKFLDLIQDVFTKEGKEQTLKGSIDTSYRHNPSSATMITDDGRVVGACLRSLYYKATKEPQSEIKAFTNTLQAGFGTAIGDYLEKVLLKSDKIKMIAEHPGKVIVDPLTKEISYRLDGLVTSNGEQGCLELKTMQSFGLNSMVKSGGPKEAHILQVLCYFGTNENIRWASLVYFSRDSAYRAEYHIYKDPETNKFKIHGITPEKQEKDILELSFEKVVTRWRELEVFVETKTLPKRDYKVVLTKEGLVTDKRTKNGVDYKTDFHCTYCSWLGTCWSGVGAKEDSYRIPGDK